MSTAGTPAAGFRLQPWHLLALVAVAAGVWFRFKGVGTWPMAVDEYYIYRSIRYLIESGVPMYPCGGFYTRGLLYQYTVAPLLIAGMPPEGALRGVTVLCSLIMLPAAYLLARELAPRHVAVAVASLAVVILALSAWEIEMARFARMYAPFQALFVWYLYHCHRLVRYGETDRWPWLLGLSAVAPLTWEGGFFLSVFNFLPMLLSRDSWRYRHLVIALIIGTVTFVFLTTNFRYMGGGPPPFSEAFEAMQGEGEGEVRRGIVGRVLASVPVLMVMSLSVWQWLVAGAVAAVLGFGLWTAVRDPRGDALSRLSLLGIAAAVLLNQLMLALVIAAAAPLLGWLRPGSMSVSGWVWYLATLALATLLWMAMLLVAAEPFRSLADPIRALSPLYDFPNFKQQIIEPWLYTIPLITLTLVAGCAAAYAHALLEDTPRARALRWALLLLLAGLTVVAVVPTPYRATRYAFFLYPLMVILALVGAAWVAQRLGATRAVVAGPLAVVALFLISNDFPVRHLLSIDSYETNFRVGYSARMENHFYDRFDHRGPGDYLHEHAEAGDRIVVTHVALQPYLPWLDYVYLDYELDRYTLHACNHGRVERWTNEALLADGDAVRAVMAEATGGVTWLVVGKRTRQQWFEWENDLVQSLGLDPVFTTRDDEFEVYRVPDGAVPMDPAATASASQGPHPAARVFAGCAGPRG